MRLANENASAKVTRCDATRRLKERCKAERVSIAGQTLFSRVERERGRERQRLGRAKCCASAGHRRQRDGRTDSDAVGCMRGAGELGRCVKPRLGVASAGGRMRLANMHADAGCWMLDAI